MEFGNVQRLEIVVRRFDFRAFDDGEANGEEDVFDFLEDLADEVMGADGADDAGERKIDSFACDRGFFGSGLDGRAARFDFRLHIRAQFIQRCTDGALQLGGSRLKPVVRDLGEDAGFAAQPAVTEYFPF